LRRSTIRKDNGAALCGLILAGFVFGCGSEVSGEPTAGTATGGGATTGGTSYNGTNAGGAGAGWTASVGGTNISAGGGKPTTSLGKGGSGTGGKGTAGNTTAGSGTGGKASGGTGAVAGSATGGAGGSVITATTPLDCGPQGFVAENHGPPANRVNYVILGDGYASADLAAGGKFETHIKNTMTKRFSAIGEVYGRYRNFVNICAIKLVSTGGICSNSALGCCGSDSTRMASCNSSSVNAAFNALPASLSIDWRAIMLNSTNWWNTGAVTMIWSGGHAEAGGAALHEGGHGFHGFADEYCASGNNSSCGGDTNWTGTVFDEPGGINVTGEPTTTGGKWDLWKGYNQVGATGLQSTFLGANYQDAKYYRPSANSMMNSLFGNNPNTSYNSVSREQMIMDIWRFVKPIDSTDPPAGNVSNPGILTVNVIDPAVISVDWTADGTKTENGGTTYDTSGLAAGTHTITATAYDNATEDLVRNRSSTCPTSVKSCSRTAWKNSTQTVTWTITK
jgi:hypothetical protein